MLPIKTLRKTGPGEDKAAREGKDLDSDAEKGQKDKPKPKKEKKEKKKPTRDSHTHSKKIADRVRSLFRSIEFNRSRSEKIMYQALYRTTEALEPWAELHAISR